MTDAEARGAIAAAVASIAPEADLESVPPGADLREELDLDSMDVMNLVAALHERTGVAIPDRDVPGLRSLDDVARYPVAAS